MTSRRGEEGGANMFPSKALTFNGCAPAASSWHDSGDIRRMTTLVVSFSVLGGLLCALVSLDHQASEAAEATAVRSLENKK